MTSNLYQDIISKWAAHMPLDQQIITLAEKVQNIPYGIINSRDPQDVYKKMRGTCSGKHALLKNLYHELGIQTQNYIALHKFIDLPVTYPKHLINILNRSDIIDPHSFLKIFRKNEWITVDITWDPPLEKLGFPVNKSWDGISDMKLAVIPLEIIKTDNLVKTKEKILSQMSESTQNDRLLFLKEFSLWLESERSH